MNPIVTVRSWEAIRLKHRISLDSHVGGLEFPRVVGDVGVQNATLDRIIHSATFDQPVIERSRLGVETSTVRFVRYLEMSRRLIRMVADASEPHVIVAGMNVDIGIIAG